MAEKDKKVAKTEDKPKKAKKEKIFSNLKAELLNL